MVAHGTYGLARRALKIYVLTDLVLGPLLVGAGLLAWALLIAGIAASWHLGVPWPLAMTAVGLAWAAIALGCRRVVRRVLGLMRAPVAVPGA
jgi:hypothetical protein